MQSVFDDYENPEYLTSLTSGIFSFAVQPVGITIHRLITRFGDSENIRVARRLWVFLL